jgi:hypothetical protein
MSYFNPNTAPSSSTSVDPYERSYITVIKSLNKDAPLNKKYQLASGKLQSQPYANAYRFKAKSFAISGIEELADLLSKVSLHPQQCIIRGLHQKTSVPNTQRRKDIFPEHHHGTPWVMIDFDDIPLPDGIDPLGTKALEHGISKLPTCFHGVSYYYQFSSSAGIQDHEGKLLKTGLNAHAFFWLDRRIPGPQLSAWLQHESLMTNQYEIIENKGGVPMIKHPFDPAVIKNCVQPHYTALPTIGEGVECRLKDEDRQGLVKKLLQSVPIPPINITPLEIKHREKQIRNRWKIDHGAVLTTIPTSSKNGTAVQKEWIMPRMGYQTGRKCIGYEFADESRERIHLKFEYENTPGSWWVGNNSPTIARRYGDEQELPLWELSSSAFDMVAHELGWFYRIVHDQMHLTDSGYLPDLKPLVTARVTTILAPTGSGKTFAISRWIKEQRSLVIYTAETIALNHQTLEDLRESGVTTGYYQEIKSSAQLQSLNCVVTTHKSLPRILALANSSGRHYDLVIDEVHMAIDYALKNTNNLKKLEAGISKAKQTICLTGTITDVQTKFLADMIFQALGPVDDDVYRVYEFAPHKSNDLEVWDDKHFDGLVFEALERVQLAKQAGEAPPRIVVIAPTSKLELYRIMLNQLEIADVANVVSKSESDQEDIKRARLSREPILISSPLFALGINFVVPPDELYVAYKRLEVDTNWIQQAVNRANRTNLPCRTVLCVGPSDPTPTRLPSKVQQRYHVELHLENESTLQGLLQTHLHLDRATAMLLRKLEQNSKKAVHQLVDHDGVQNYRVIDRRSESTEVDEETLKGLRKASRNHYDGLINDYRRPYSTPENGPFLARLATIRQARNAWKEARIYHNDMQFIPDNGCQISCFSEFSQVILFGILFEDAIWLRNSEKVPASSPAGALEIDVKSNELALVADFCGLETRSHMEEVSIIKLRRLLGEAFPWVSSQYYGQIGQYDAMACKLSEIISLLDTLEEIREGRSTDWFAKCIRGKSSIRAAIRALANNEADFHAITNRHERIAALHKAYQRSSSRKNAQILHTTCFEEAKLFFKSLGVRWEVKKNSDGRWEQNYDAPILTPHLNFQEARSAIKHLIAICQACNDHTIELHVDGDEGLHSGQRRHIAAQERSQRATDTNEEEYWANADPGTVQESPVKSLLGYGYRSAKTCQGCLFNRNNLCMRGLSIDWLDDMLPDTQVHQCHYQAPLPAHLK